MGCPQCALSQQRRRRPTFAESQHPLLAEWDHRRNSHLNNFPHNTRLQSDKQIWWLCTKCPAGQEHSWSAPPARRIGRHQSGCPVCAGRAACRCNSLQALYPDAAAEQKSRPAQRVFCQQHSQSLVAQLSVWQLAADHPLTHKLYSTEDCKAEAHTAEAESCKLA